MYGELLPPSRQNARRFKDVCERDNRAADMTSRVEKPSPTTVPAGDIHRGLEGREEKRLAAGESTSTT